jgi:hypothetical protein
MPDIPLGCAIAIKASYKDKWVYAITKYGFSISLCSILGVDRQPEAEYIPITKFPAYHVRLSHAIVSAYSAIEDLGLELRVTRKNPSKINGEWNPIVKSELEQRLSGANIRFNDPILWTRRGPITKIEKKRATPVLAKVPWARGIHIRDCEISLIDAIAYSKWLRNEVASHNTKDLTKVISVYDVLNVQHLVRRLLLETLGFWYV